MRRTTTTAWSARPRPSNARGSRPGAARVRATMTARAGPPAGPRSRGRPPARAAGLGAPNQFRGACGHERAERAMSGGESVLFWILAPVMVIAAFGLLFSRKAVHAALCMAWVMISLGIVYFAQQAPFLGAVQVFVYTGAVMMLFLFVLMLVGVDSSDSIVETIKGQRWFALVFGVGLAVLVISVIGDVTFPDAAGLKDVDTGGNITALAGLIFGQYVWAFEVTSALLIT